MLLQSRKKEVEAATTQPQSSGRVSWVYHARGLALMLIVYRHIVLGMKFSDVEVSPFMYNFQLFFFNFRMPAFFLLSGVFLANSLRKRKEAIVAKDKVFTLLYPYILWASIMLLTQIGFEQFSNARRGWGDFIYILTQPRKLDQLWYLLALFNASMLYIFLNKVLHNRKAIHLLIATVLHVISYNLYGNSLLSDPFYFYIFLFAGSLLLEQFIDAKKSSQIFNQKYFLLAIPVFLLGQWFWFSNMEKKGFYYIIFFLIILVGCFFLFSAANLLARSKKNEWLAYIGRYSLYIYILHVQVAAVLRKVIRNAFPDVDPWLLFAGCYISAIVLPIVFIRVFKNYGVERLFTLKTSGRA
jgi:fucose 4-O-acetylase-like acetyltransferase